MQEFLVRDEIACPLKDRDPSCSMCLPTVDPVGRTLGEAASMKDVVVPSDDPTTDNNGEDRPLE